MVVLFDDRLAMELGATVFGAATDVFVNADGHKKSIAGPGVGNYITMAKAVAAATREAAMTVFMVLVVRSKRIFLTKVCAMKAFGGETVQRETNKSSSIRKDRRLQVQAFY